MSFHRLLWNCLIIYGSCKAYHKQYIKIYFIEFIMLECILSILCRLTHSILLATLWSRYDSFQFSSVAQSCPIICDPMNCSTPGLPVYHQLPEFTQTHIHRVSNAIQPSHPRPTPSPPAPNPSQHQMLDWIYSWFYLKVLVSQSCLSLWDAIDYSLPGSLCPWDFPSKHTGVGCHSLLQGIFPTQETNPGLLHCRQILCHLSHKGSPSYLKITVFNVWVLTFLTSAPHPHE